MNKFLLLLVFLAADLFADQPPDWSAFIVQSENKGWSATVHPEGVADTPWKDSWVLNIYKGFHFSYPAPNVKPVWTTKYNPSGYSGGYLSNDGSTFSYVEAWYYPYSPVVKIYREECKILKNGSYFAVGDKLQKTVSHELWLKGGGNVEYLSIDGNLYLQLETIKGPRKIEISCNEEA
ncbi:hypothetical protein ACJJIF_01475 [Microbulbifer sp. SSSA002]|uniref:hypothetical protein n=1 Tax=Microbulbifer sp. SSSA002 TaxID=3243376 RepID=UPI00403A1E95